MIFITLASRCWMLFHFYFFAGILVYLARMISNTLSTYWESMIIWDSARNRKDYWWKSELKALKLLSLLQRLYGWIIFNSLWNFGQDFIKTTLKMTVFHGMHNRTAISCISSWPMMLRHTPSHWTGRIMEPWIRYTRLGCHGCLICCRSMMCPAHFILQMFAEVSPESVELVREHGHETWMSLVWSNTRRGHLIYWAMRSRWIKQKMRERCDRTCPQEG